MPGFKRKHDADSSFQKLVENARKKQKTVDDIPKYYMRLNELQEIYENALQNTQKAFLQEHTHNKNSTVEEKKKLLEEFENEIKIKAMEKANKIKKTTEKEGRIEPDYEELDNANINIDDIAVYDEQPFSEHVDTPEELFRFVEFFQVLQQKFENDMDFAEAEKDGAFFGGKKKSKSNQKKKSKRKQKTKHRRKSTRKSRRKPRSHKK